MAKYTSVHQGATIDSVITHVENIETTDNNGKIVKITNGILDVTENPAVWGSITGTLSSQDDLNTALNARVLSSTLGQANGVATLDANGKVNSSQLPLYTGEEVGD